MKRISLMIGLCIWGVILLTSIVQAESTTKVLVNIVEDQGEEPSRALIRSSEMLIGRKLIMGDMEVVLSDDLSPGKTLTKKDIEAARNGSVGEIRKAAAANGAAYILSAKAKTRVGEENVSNMLLNKAVTSFAYRFINTATGKTLEMDSLTFVSASRSAESAVHATYEKFSSDISERMIKKFPKKLSNSDSKRLAGYKASLAPKPKPKPEPMLVAAENSTPAPAQDIAAVQVPAKNKQIKAAPVPEHEGKLNGPEIVILNPPSTRGFKTVSKEKKIKIEGLAIDTLGISEVRINGAKVAYNKDGRFSHSAILKNGENRFLIMAVNTSGQIVTKNLAIDRDKDKTGPEIILLRPQASRGFKVALKSSETKIIVEGIVKDNNKLLFTRINNTDIKLSENGHFIHELLMADDISTINIEAADVDGNISTKSLQVARGNNEWAEANPSRVTVPGTKPVLWGLAIGVSKYNSKAINLKYADQDALQLEKFFTSQTGNSFSEVHFKTLINEQVTRNSIIESITSHLGMAAPDDIIFLFLAGHGIKHRQSGSYYFMPSDSDFDTILSTGLRMSDFEESITILSKNVNKILVAMDTCHSGALEVGMRSAGTTEDLAESISSASGIYILSASKAGEVSLESEKFKLGSQFSGHGVFTYSLVEAMQGQADYDKNKYISLNEVFQFVSRQVPRLTNGQQHPYFRMQGTDLPLIKLK